MKTSLTIALALLSAIPILAADAPTTQPAATQPAKPKARLNDPPPRRVVPIKIEKVGDVWKFLPEDLRPGKDGVVSEELGKKISAWVDANGKKIEAPLVFVATRVDRDGDGPTVKATSRLAKDNTEVNLTAYIKDQKERDKYSAVKITTGNQDKTVEVKGAITELKFSMSSSAIKFTLESSPVQVVAVKVVPRAN